MRYSFKTILHSILVGACVANATVIRDGYYGSRERRTLRQERRRAAVPSVFEVQGLDVLKTYVCPSSANEVKRQVEIISGSTSVTIPATDLQTLYTELEELIAQLVAIMVAQGLQVPQVNSFSIAAASVASGTTPVLTLPALAGLAGASTTNENGRTVATSTQNVASSTNSGTTASQTTTSAASVSINPTAAPVNQYVVTVTVTQFATVTFIQSATSEAAATSSASIISSPSGSTSINQKSEGNTASTTLLTATLETASAASVETTSYSQIGITVMIGNSPTTSAEAPEDTESACWEDDEEEDEETTMDVATSTSSANSASVDGSVTTTAESVAASSTTNAAGAAVTSSVSYSNSSVTTSSLSTIPSSIAVGASSSASAAASSSSSSSVSTSSAAASSLASSASSSSSSSSVSTSSAAASSTSVSDYSFNAASESNVAVYFGQTAATDTTSLEAQCADSDIDIVVLAFVVENDYEGSKYPLVNFGAACDYLQTDEMKADAPGLLSCPDLAAMITTCQSDYGKKVLLSIGGATGSTIFTNSTQASDFATILWELFGPPGAIDVGLRPFGTVAVDGFDVDNENNHPAYYDVLGSTLKAAFATQSSKDYYLTSAPQCPFPDASDPSALLLECDFVFVQFYNNAPCEIGSTGFNASLAQWSTFLETSNSTTKPKLYVGAPAWSEAGPTAYANIGSAEGMETVAREIVSLDLPNLGGIMFWDGSEGMLNTEDGKDIITWAKEGLTS